jgi:hypothetical protein
VSVNAQIVVNEAAALIGDPAFSRITTEGWRVMLNESCRDVVVKLRLQMWRATFDLVANDPEYALPDDCIQVKRIEVNETPSDQTTWWDVGEWFEDEFRAATNGYYPLNTRPVRYTVWVDTYNLYMMPDTTIPGGGRITYWGLCDDVTDLGSQNIPVLDFMRDRVRDRMLIYGFRRLKQWDSAAAAEKEWEAALSADRARIEDRSADRRARLRTPAGNRFGLR